jgi:hypothetical protein
MKHPSTIQRQSAIEWLEVIRLSRVDWRISDSRIDVDDSTRLLGYIERQFHDRYEVLWMTDPLRWAYVESFDAALAGFGESARFTVQTQADRRESDSPRGGAPAPRRMTWGKPRGRADVA